MAGNRWAPSVCHQFSVPALSSRLIPSQKMSINSPPHLIRETHQKKLPIAAKSPDRYVRNRFRHIWMPIAHLRRGPCRRGQEKPVRRQLSSRVWRGKAVVREESPARGQSTRGNQQTARIEIQLLASQTPPAIPFCQKDSCLPEGLVPAKLDTSNWVCGWSLSPVDAPHAWLGTQPGNAVANHFRNEASIWAN